MLKNHKHEKIPLGSDNSRNLVPVLDVNALNYLSEQLQYAFQSSKNSF